jgi:hypothetical protein
VIDPDTREFLERLGKKPAEPPPRTFPHTNIVDDARPRSAAPDPLLDSNIDIPLDRIAREFRKRAGRAYGLGQDTKAKVFRDICDAIEKIDDGERAVVAGDHR